MSFVVRVACGEVVALRLRDADPCADVRVLSEKELDR